MNINVTILEYLRVILTGPVLFSVLAITFILVFREDIKALILRIAKIKFPGGEVSTPQSKQLAAEEEKPAPDPSIKDEVQITGLPIDLTPAQRTEVEQLIRSHIATAYIWEYRYLNFFLARGTQMVLDWLVGLPQPATYSYYESVWIPAIPASEERSAIINALQSHHLVQFKESGLIEVTPKGREYQEWRGPLPPLTRS